MKADFGAKKINFPLFFKLLALSGILILVIVVITILSQYSYDNLKDKERISTLIIKYNEISKEISSMEYRRRDDLETTFANDTSKITKHLKFIDSISKITNLIEDKEFQSQLDDYKKNIGQFIINIEKIGLTENDGIEGTFRINIHNLEKFLTKNKDYEALTYLLQARRSEKDFIMRHRQEYVEKVYKNISFLEAKLKSKYKTFDSTNFYLQNYLTSFRDYLEAFNNLRHSFISIKINEENLDRIFSQKYLFYERQANFSQKVVTILMILSIITGLVLTYYYAKNITKPVSELQKATLQVANGNFKVKLSIKTEDEFSQLGEFFNSMVASIEHNNKLILRQNKELTEINEELQTLNATKDKLFSIIAHDLKNPLASFKTAIEYLHKDYYMFSDEEKIELLNEISDSAKSVYELLENLLQWSLAQRNKTPFNPVQFNFKDIVETTLSQLSLHAKNKKISLINHITEPIEVNGDVNLLTIVVRNLVSNAIKFTREGGSVQIDGKVNEDNNYYLVSVKDNGVGIPPEKLSKIFKIESSGSTRGTHNETGTGLGLLLCKEYVEKHGGRIWVESELDIGTTFYFTIPLT